MRFALALVALVAVPALAAPPDLAGTWNVTSTEIAGGSCANEPGKVWAHTWLVGTNADGTLNIAVQGETQFPAFEATVEKNRVIVTGLTKTRSEGMSRVADATWMSLEVKNGQLVGVRRFLTTAVVRLERNNTLVPCFIDMNVVAKR